MSGAPTPRPEPALSLPNLLTLSRVPLAILIWWDAGDALFATATLAIAGLTDVLDGTFARWIRARRLRRGLATTVGSAEGAGAWLDPLCDKIFVTSALAAIAVAKGSPLLLVLLIATRELLMAPITLIWRFYPGRWQGISLDLRAGWPGKLATVAQFAAMIAAILAHPSLPIAAGIAGGTGLVAVLYYLERGWKVVYQQGDAANP